MKLKGPLRHSERREKTLIKLLGKYTFLCCLFFSNIAIFLNLRIDVTGLLAGAGVLGLSSWIWCTKSCERYYSGFFIIFEDQFSVGDYVQIGMAVGLLKKLDFVQRKLSAYGGEVYIFQMEILQKLSIIR